MGKSHWIDHDGSENPPVATRDVLDVIWTANGLSAGMTLENIDWRQVVSYRLFEPSDDRDLIGYAQRLATVAAQKVGCDENWRPMKDLSGCLTQIDNAMTGMVVKPDFIDGPRGWLIKDEFDADPEAWFHTNYEDQAREYAITGTPVFALPDFDKAFQKERKIVSILESMSGGWRHASPEFIAEQIALFLSDD